MPSSTIDSARCKGCGLCVSACPMHVIVMDEDTLNDKGYAPAKVMHIEKCTGCAACYGMCPDCAITAER